jgi:AcrR family transcriptional regulator
MSEQDKGTKRNVYFKSKKRYELFKAICEELGTNISERLNFLIEEDIERMIAVVQAYKESRGEKN